MLQYGGFYKEKGKFMKSIFIKEPINNKRQIELDIAKGLALVFMVWVHTNEYYQGTQYHGGFYNRMVEFLGSPPAAPVFMFLLGLGIVYSSKSTPSKLMKRGVLIFISGYVLSFCRDVLPYALLFRRERDTELLIEAWDLLWGVDILQFAGLTFLFFAFVKKFNITQQALFLFWCVFATLNMVLRDITFSSDFANGFFGLFWGTDDYSWFPFLNWITFPIQGYVCGYYIMRCTDKRALYKRVLILAGTISIPLWIYSYVNDVQFGAFGELWQQAYYHHDIMGSLVLSAFAMLWISLCYFAEPFIPEFFKVSLSRWSKNVNTIYCIHYTILGFLLLVLSEEGYHPIMVCIIGLVVLFVSDLLCTIYNNRSSFALRKKKEALLNQLKIDSIYNSLNK